MSERLEKIKHTFELYKTIPGWPLRDVEQDIQWLVDKIDEQEALIQKLEDILKEVNKQVMGIKKYLMEKAMGGLKTRKIGLW